MTSEKPANRTKPSGIWECNFGELNPGKEGVSFLGNPKAIDSPFGSALSFNGENDAVFIDTNPLKGLTSYTIEALFRPDLNGPEEQRFLHIGESDSDRLLLETRSTKDGKWYLDTFVLSGENKMALLDPTLLHPIGPWYHVALTIGSNGEMTNYVNGEMELRGKADSHLISSGQMSIGVRQNKISWFKGAIQKIRISSKVLDTKELMH